jgi:hypothetical protein
MKALMLAAVMALGATGASAFSPAQVLENGKILSQDTYLWNEDKAIVTRIMVVFNGDFFTCRIEHGIEVTPTVACSIMKNVYAL